MADSLRPDLNRIPLRNATATLREGERPRRNPTPRGALVEQAMKNAGLLVKQMASDMDVSESFLLRGFKDHEHISWQRLARVQSPAFHREFLALQAQALPGVEVVTTIAIKRPA